MEGKTAAQLLMLLLLGSGGAVLLTQSQYDSAYVCDGTTFRTMFFDRLSDTGKTGYYVVDGVNKTAVCTTVWMKLDTYAKANNISKESLVQANANRVAEAPLVMTCDLDHCLCRLDE